MHVMGKAGAILFLDNNNSNTSNKTEKNQPRCISFAFVRLFFLPASPGQEHLPK